MKVDNFLDLRDRLEELGLEGGEEGEDLLGGGEGGKVNGRREKGGAEGGAAGGEVEELCGEGGHLEEEGLRAG